jgi:hypothetical protein
MTATKSRNRPFNSTANHWEANTAPTAAEPATLNSPDGQQVPGLRILYGGNRWMILTEANAVQLARDILTVIDTRRANEGKP